VHAHTHEAAAVMHASRVTLQPNVVHMCCSANSEKPSYFPISDGPTYHSITARYFFFFFPLISEDQIKGTGCLCYTILIMVKRLINQICIRQF
jgi:hypothetical protein